MAQSSRRCYCSVPFCSNNKQKFLYLSFHDFPVDGETRACWVRAIRRDEGPRFRILRGSTFVCSQHFPPGDIYTLASGRIHIKHGSVPSRFHWNDWGGSSQARQSVYQRARKCLGVGALDDSDHKMPDSKESALPAVANNHDYACHPSPGKLDSATQRIRELELQVLSLEIEIRHLTVKKQHPVLFKFCVTDEDYRYYTRFAQRRSSLCFGSLSGLQEKTLSTIFEVSLSTVSRIILTWTSYLYQVLGSLPVWMSREQVQATMPDKFKLYCPQPGDEVMADKGFLIKRMLSEVGATLIIPPLKKSPQLSKEDTLKTQAIARLRILVERAIRRVKEYHIRDGLVPLSTVGFVNQLWAICCLLSNYQGPLDIGGDKPV
ncbi:hypothetical protein UPYG_G00124870 [Umbra pygmaea]|uniref:THAP-type domain-containing protein n=1 Tax=Umbra pygmaea TaxID=75934 RepID=A0ABD0X5T2_UMBPY